MEIKIIKEDYFYVLNIFIYLCIRNKYYLINNEILININNNKTKRIFYEYI